jgi:single-stranded-DNA-specific exonuclease
MKSYEIREEIPNEISEKLSIYPELVRKLLYYRDITDKDKAEKFFNPNYEEDLHDPFLMPNIEEATDRILKAIKENQKITIYSDYDADGIPGAVIFSDFFKMINFQNFDVYIPHRNKEGFGLNIEALEKIADAKTKLLITVDCGMADIKEVDFALNELNLDVIITDHHKDNGEVPKTIIVNHKLKDSKYPEQNLCGAGVVFKLIQALIKKGNFDISKGKEKWLLDMVGIATLSDMVPLVGENRTLASYGLLVLRKTPRRGLLKLFRKTGVKQNDINETDVGFTISPRINAASRMGEPEVAYRMLSTDDEVEAEELVKHLHEINDLRKGHVAAITKAVHKKLENKNIEEMNVIVAGNPDWQPSLLGLAANSLAEHYSKPAFLWGRGEGKEIKGSCRSANAINTHDILVGASDVFTTFGGHDEAGGFVVGTDKVDLLENALNEAYQKAQSEGKAEPLWIDHVLSIDELNPNLHKDILKFAPFGMENPEPIFLFKSVMIKTVEQFGKHNDHLKLFCFRENNSPVSAISFYAKPNSFSKKVSSGDIRDIVGTIEKESWGNRNDLRIRILDIL